MTATVQPLPTLFTLVDRLIPAPLRADSRQWQAARHLALLAGVTAASAPLLTLMYHFLGFDAAGMVVLSGAVVMMVTPFTLNAGFSLALARDVFVGALFALKVWLALHLGGLAAPTVPWFLLCPAVALLVGGLRPGLAWCAIVLLTLVALYVAEHVGGPMTPYPVTDPAVLQLVSLVGLFVLSSIIVALALNAAGAERRAR
jgi:hypothetical protein